MWLRGSAWRVCFSVYLSQSNRWDLFSVYPGWNEFSKGMSTRMEVAPAVGLRRLLNGLVSRGERGNRRREPAGSVCLRRSCCTSSSICLYWIGLSLLRYPQHAIPWCARWIVFERKNHLLWLTCALSVSPDGQMVACESFLIITVR